MSCRLNDFMFLKDLLHLHTLNVAHCQSASVAMATLEVAPVLASFPGPTKERRGPGTHCSRMRGLHGNQVAGVIDEAQTELVYL